MADKKSSKARAIGRAAFAGTKGTTTGAIVGAVSYFAHRAATERSETVQKSWYIGPGLMLVGGHFLKKKASTAAAGAAMVGAAGYAAAMGYSFARAAETKGLQRAHEPLQLRGNEPTERTLGTSACPEPEPEPVSEVRHSVAEAMGL